MLSILITIYNYNLYPLVQELHSQCIENKIVFEILTQDDASNSKFNIENEEINKLENCNFISLEINVGYRENKNILVQRSKYENLLILDGDCLIIKKDYIKNYLTVINNYDGIYGGRVHSYDCPSNNQMLRWKYGRLMEDKTTIEREKSTYSSFLFNNTLIKKNVFNKIKFDSSFKKYGHDDTLFSFELQKINAKIKHIENPIQHDDIDTNLVFYNKMKGSLENLYFLYSNKMIDSNHSKMVKLTQKIKKYYLIKPIVLFYSIFEKPIKNNLTGSNPKLFIFNVYRLGYFCTLFLK